MSFSEDEYDQPTMQEPHVSMSKAELRKTHKPLMEKRRRARINNFLNEIKNLILEAMNKDPARHTKLEKADILEMAVKHLQNVQRQQLALAMATDPSVVRKFKSGFNECATEIDRYLVKNDAIEKGVRDRVTNHLHKCINSLDHANQFSLQPTGNISMIPSGAFFSTTSQDSQSGDQNNNPRVQIPQGIQLIPSRLPTGELALLVPNSSNLSYFPSTTLPQRSSAFVTVTSQTVEPPRSVSPDRSPAEPVTLSPKGFRPVHPNIVRPKPSYIGEDHQVPQISSTVEQTNKEKHCSSSGDLKTVRFPMQKNLDKEKKAFEHISVIKKVSEPLCTITNQAERFRQAQQKEDSVYLEENQTNSRGVKRSFSEINQGISITVCQESRPSKLIKTSHHVVPSSTLVHPASEPFQEGQRSSLLLAISKRNIDFSSHSHEESRPFELFNPLNQEPQRLEHRNEQYNELNERNAESNDMWRPW
ncbi:uncharacterized protein LOC115880516 [Sitophilus oryzae]|uniref:Uncharacterized protein LOC115880516 n=1 Tax=Sitophilus oryzae TaxID=7048 RepID=A0A6J2XRX1_SITOR|nr:uncharacterized protein LOC115880516 [Sitophilus oryzae]